MHRAQFYGDKNGLVFDVLRFPLCSGIDLTPATAREGVVVGPPVNLPLLDESLLDEGVEVGVQTSVVDLFFVVSFELYVLSPQANPLSVGRLT